MSSSGRRVVVFGGSGFLGHKVVARLVQAGFETRVAVRRPARFGRDQGPVAPADVDLVQTDIRHEASVAAAIENCIGVVNAVGLYVESKTASFEAIHEQGARAVADQAMKQGAENLVHLSGIGADPTSRSRYVRSRARGEFLVGEAYPQATILRPSVLFGPDDGFVNALAGLVRRSPIVPLFGRGRTRLQPVYVGDVAQAVVNALGLPAARGRIYELGGPRAYPYRALLALILARMHRRRLLMPIPFPIWSLLAAIGSVLPNPPITDGQVALMRRDNVVGANMPSLGDLGIEPTALEAILPAYAL